VILAKNEDAAQYLGICPSLDGALRRLLEGLDGLEPGHYDMDGDNLWLNCFDYETLPEAECFYEAHKAYGDIHIMLKGKEKVSISHPDTLTCTEVREGEDFAAYEGEAEETFVLSPGSFLVVFPGDAHKIKMQVDGSEPVRKAVFKFKL
jgi:YhcH/YjgK/YiaL family protein